MKATAEHSTHSASRIQRNSNDASPFFTPKQADNKEAAPTAEPFFQPKLKVGAPNDKYEQEADAVADQVVQGITEEKARPQVQGEVGTSNEPTVQRVVAAPVVTPLPISRIQRSAEPEAEEKMEPEEEEVALQRKAIFDSDGEGDVQRDGGDGGDGSFSASDDFSSRLSDSQGSGSPLPSETRNSMEEGIGADFSGVRVHTGSEAAGLSNDIGAEAFTHGSDVYFNEGNYAPGTEGGDRLLAHELTHTVQQGGVQRKAIQRVANTASPAANQEQAVTNDDAPAEPPEVFTDPEKGTIDLRTNEKQITIPELKVPNFKVPFTPSTNLTIPKKTDEERPNTQAATWSREVVAQSNYTTALSNKLKIDEAPAHTAGRGLPIYFLKIINTPENFVIGNETAIKNRSARPFWNPDGERTFYDVDHKQELQLGGEDTLNNYWLLESKANQSSGRNIKNERNGKIRQLLSASAQGENALWTAPPDLDTVRRQYRITFDRVVGGLPASGEPEFFYNIDDIKSGIHFDGLHNMTKEEVDAAGLKGDPENLKVYTNASGGGVRDIPWGQEDGTTKALGSPVRIGRNFTINSVSYTAGVGGSVSGPAFKKDRETGIISTKTITLDIAELEGIEYGGYISQSSINRELKNTLTASFASPMELSEIGLQSEEGFVGRGKIKPELPFLSADTTIDVVIDGDGARLEKVFNIGELNVPAPFEISNSELFVSYGTGGLQAGGRVNFGINRVGEGFVEGRIGTDGKLAVQGRFDFDTELFDPARVEVSYLEGVLSVTGTIGIPRNKVTGIKRADVVVNYSEGSLTANGDAELDIKGIESGTLNLAYSEDQFKIGGTFQLSNEIPGINGGSVEVEVEKGGTDEGWKVKATGTAQPDIPGISTSLTVAYDDGALLIEGRASYQRGLLSGTVEVGATNRAIGDDGQPTGPPGDNFSAYGGGELTLQLTPWLAATAGVRLLPNGEIEVKGKIGLPSSVDIFPRKSIDRNLFRMPTIEIPIFAIPLGPRSLGIVATINGGLDFTAGFGPGQLQELFGEVTYNPSQPDDASLHGRGKFVIPADAGLSLKADLGLGLSVGIASLTGGIEIAGALGLEGEAAAEVDVNWSPTEGFSIDALGSITVNPKFQFDVNLLARAKLDLWLFSISKEWRHNLASFQWGPDIQFGIKFPIHYTEGEPFDVSFDDLELIYPELDIGSLASGIAKDVKSDVF